MSEPEVEPGLDETAPMPAEIPADLALRTVRGVEVAVDDQAGPPPPLIRCRDATAHEIPGEAVRAARIARERGLDVRVTFAQGGVWRRWRERGVCATCGSKVMLLAEDKRDAETGAMLQPHSPPAAGRCPGSGRPAVLGRLCAGCDVVPKKINKSGTVPPHDVPRVPCPDQSASDVVPGEPRPPVCSIAVRVARLAVACWYVEFDPPDEATGRPGKVSGKYDIGFTWDGTYLARVGAADFQRACREGVPVG